MKDLCLLEGKANFSKSLQQFDGLTGLTPTPVFYDRSIYATGIQIDFFISTQMVSQ